MAARPMILVLMHLLLFAAASLQNYKDSELDEELDILREEDVNLKLPVNSTSDDDDDGDSDDDNADFRGSGNSGEDVDEAMPNIDDKDVVVLKDRNFATVIESNEFVMVEFYAPWCALCGELAPEYAAAASELKEENVVLAKVDAMEESELAHEFDVQGFPTVLFFVDGVSRIYKGQRTKDAIVTWIKKNIGPGVTNITTLDEAEQILTSHNRLALAFLNSLAGSESREIAAASKLDDDIRFYQTINGDIANVFRIGPIVKRPALVLLKKEAEKLSYFAGNFVRAEIADFVLANKLPLVTTFTRDLAPSIFESQIKKQLLLFANSNTSDEIFLTFQDAAKSFKGKIIFILIRTDDDESGRPVADHFGITETSSKIILAYTGNEDSRKFFFDGDINLESLKGFAEDFLEDRLKPFYSSAQVPETNDGDVKIVVGNNFDEIVLDESKDVLLEIYAPWCGHCQALEPIYNRLARHLRGVRSIVVAKMDATTNEHPRAKPDGYPTILFFPAGNKSFDPVTVEVERTVVDFYKFLKKHASIPFRLQRPRPSSAGDGVESSATNLKDEL